MAQLSGAFLDVGQNLLVDILDPADSGPSGQKWRSRWGQSATAASPTQVGPNVPVGDREDVPGSDVTQPTADTLQTKFTREHATGGVTIREVVTELFWRTGVTAGMARFTHTARTLIDGDRIEYIIKHTMKDSSE